MSSVEKPVEAEAMVDLRNRVDDLALKLMLGTTEKEQWVLSLEELARQAEIAGRADVARIVVESIETVSNPAAGAQPWNMVLSNNIVRMQQAIEGNGIQHLCSTPAPIDPSQISKHSTSSTSAETPSLGDDRELIADFLLEARDHLIQVEIQIMTLEKAPEDREAINTVFRAFHTIKGLSAFLDLSDMRDVAHETETLLDMVRSQKLRITSETVDIVLAAADYLKVSLARLEATLIGGVAGPVPEKAHLVERIRSGIKGEFPAPRRVAEISAAVIEAETNFPNALDTPATDAIATERRTSGVDRRAQITESHSVKVDTGKLDFLVEMAGEMVVAQSIVQHHPDLAALQSPTVQRSLAQLARITTDLQKTAMSMRMVPVGGLFQKMSRLVRDLSRKTGKLAELETIGADTELDRNVVEELADPLMHMVRNAADHGLESADERHAAGKDPTGHIRLGASHQAGHIVIEITDDGRGLSREKILDKARRMGLTEDGAGLSDREVFSFIFHPGFSTATVVTDVSGRGVGMDVVKKQIQKLRGHVDIESVPGKGTSFFLRLPLTLAMIDGLVVGVGAERYVIPIHSVREMLRPSEAMLFTLENREEMAMVRNSLLPIVRLYQRFGVKPRSELATESLLVVAEGAGRSFCLMVDDLIGKQEVVIKSLGETRKDVRGVAGGAILGDGRVGLILDIEGVFARGTK